MTDQISTRTLAGLEVSAIGLGCMGMSIAYGERDEPGSVRTIHHALDRGVSFIDTADVYGFGHNEELVGRALSGRREAAVLATKFGNVKGDKGYEVRGDPEWVIEACEASLRRLETDYIDLYYLHRVDPDVDIEDTVGAMARLVEQGKVRHIGLSECSARTLERAHGVHPITALQTEYSLWTRDVEEEILPACRRLGIGFVPYSPLGRGFLTGQFATAGDLIEEDRRRAHPRFSSENMEKNTPMVQTLREVADGLGATPAQVALAWLLAQGEGVVPIPGTKKVTWLDQNIGATELALDETALAALDAAFPRGATAGERYPVHDMEKLGL